MALQSHQGILPNRRRWARSARGPHADASNSVIRNRRKHIALRAQAHSFGRAGKEEPLTSVEGVSSRPCAALCCETDTRDRTARRASPRRLAASKPDRAGRVRGVLRYRGCHSPGYKFFNRMRHAGQVICDAGGSAHLELLPGSAAHSAVR